MGVVCGYGCVWCVCVVWVYGMCVWCSMDVCGVVCVVCVYVGVVWMGVVCG